MQALAELLVSLFSAVPDDHIAFKGCQTDAGYQFKQENFWVPTIKLATLETLRYCKKSSRA